MRKKIFIPLLVVAAIAFLAIPVFAINFGVRDNGEHPYVGMMVRSSDLINFSACSGSLIAPDVFLTAGHCVANAPYVWVTFEEVPDLSDPFLEGPTWVTGTAHADPTFVRLASPGGPFYADDVGVIVLDEAVTDIEPATVAPLGFLDSYQTRVGTQDPIFVPVGYGIQSIKPDFEWDIARYKGEGTGSVQWECKMLAEFNDIFI